MFYDVCPSCSPPQVSELVRIEEGFAYFRCPMDYEYRMSLDHFSASSIDLAREWLYLRETYPQGSTVRVKHPWTKRFRRVEVIGHKEQVISTGRPAVRVYFVGYGSTLISRADMDAWNSSK